jgi:hypothetical protein
VGEDIRKRGAEFGATTGRPRRCGWIDIVALKRAVAINGITGLCITKLDVLDGMPSLKMCIAYKYRGKQTDAPLDAAGTRRAGLPGVPMERIHRPLPAAARLSALARELAVAARDRVHWA